MICHDVLSLFLVVKSYAYMHGKGYYGHIIVPRNGLSEGTIYAIIMVGIRPEVIPLDVYINIDFHTNIDQLHD